MVAAPRGGIMAVSTSEEAAAGIDLRGLFGQQDGAPLRAAQGLVETAETTSDPREAAAMLHRAGVLLAEAGELQQAVGVLEAAVRTLERDARSSFSNLLGGLTPKSFRRNPELGVSAAIWAGSLSTLAEAKDDPALTIRLLLDVGTAYASQPQYLTALDAYDRALRTDGLFQAPRLHIIAHVNRGLALRAARRFAEAETALRSAQILLDAFEGGEELERHVRLAWGLLVADRGNSSRARDELSKAEALHQQAGDSAGRIRALLGLAVLSLRSGDAQKAHDFARVALSLRPSSGDDALWTAYWIQGAALRRLGDLEGAARELERAASLIERRSRARLTDEGRVSFFDSARAALDELVRVHVERAGATSAAYSDVLRVAEAHRATVLRALQLDRRHRPRPSRPSRARDVRQMAGGEEIADAGPTPLTVEQKAAGGRSIPLTTERPTPVAASTATRLLYHALDDVVVVVLVRPGDAPQGATIALGREGLRAKVQKARASLGVSESIRGKAAESPTQPSDAAIYRELYELLVAPIGAQLVVGEPIVIEPHASLWLLPFAALMDKDGVRLASRHPLTLTPSWSTLSQIDADDSHARAPTTLIVANPTPPGVLTVNGMPVQFEPLAGAAREAQDLADRLPSETRLLTGDAAVETAVRAHVEAVDIAHFATHGYAADVDPGQSAIVLAPSEGEEGPFTSVEVRGLRMRADLVVLSACQTAMGRLSGEGVLGLWRSFLVAGARTVVASLWNVADEPTRILMTAFYDALLELGDKAEALRQAIATLRRDPRYDHPHYWAAFVIVGATNVLWSHRGGTARHRVKRSSATGRPSMAKVKFCYERYLPKNLRTPEPLLPQQTIGGRPTRAALVIAKRWEVGRILKAGFFGGTDIQHRNIERWASEWFEHANLGIQFGDVAGADIRIAFTSTGSWSYVGTDCASIPADQPTMNFGWEPDEGTVLHEFGHALGLIHEHQNPKATINWNRKAVIDALSGAPNYWDEATIEHNMFRRYDVDQINGTAFDSKSVMLYAFPAEWTGGDLSTDPNEALSPVDIEFIRSQGGYPHDGPRNSQSLEVGRIVPRRGNITSPGEKNVFEFTADDVGRYRVETEGRHDLVMTLYGPNDRSKVVATNDDGGRGRNPRIDHDLERGAYVVEVGHYNDQATTDDGYIIHVTR